MIWEMVEALLTMIGLFVLVTAALIGTGIAWSVAIRVIDWFDRRFGW